MTPLDQICSHPAILAAKEVGYIHPLRLRMNKEFFERLVESTSASKIAYAESVVGGKHFMGMIPVITEDVPATGFDITL